MYIKSQDKIQHKMTAEAIIFSLSTPFDSSEFKIVIAGIEFIHYKSRVFEANVEPKKSGNGRIKRI